MSKNHKVGEIVKLELVHHVEKSKIVKLEFGQTWGWTSAAQIGICCIVHVENIGPAKVEASSPAAPRAQGMGANPRR